MITLQTLTSSLFLTSDITSGLHVIVPLLAKTLVRVCQHDTSTRTPPQKKKKKQKKSRGPFHFLTPSRHSISCHGTPVERTDENHFKTDSIGPLHWFPAATDPSLRLSQKMDRVWRRVRLKAARFTVVAPDKLCSGNWLGWCLNPRYVCTVEEVIYSRTHTRPQTHVHATSRSTFSARPLVV